MKSPNKINRGWIKRQIIAGNLEIRTDMILTDDYAFDAAGKNQKSENFVKANINDFIEDDFNGPCGNAFWSADRKTFRWKKYTNHYYTCRLIAA